MPLQTQQPTRQAFPGQGAYGGAMVPSGSPKKGGASGMNCLILFAAAALFTGLYYLGGWSSRYTWPLTIASVYAHEMGHLITALVTGGEVMGLHIQLEPNIVYGASGFVRHVVSDSRLANAAVAFAGSFSQVFTGMAFVLASRSQRASRGLLVLCSVLALFSMWYADSLMTYGVIIALVAIMGCALKFLKGGLLKLFMSFSGLAMAAAMLENWRYLFSTNGSDMAHVSNYLFLPVWFWGGFVLVVGVAAIFLGIRTFVMSEAPKDEPAPGRR